MGLLGLEMLGQISDGRGNNGGDRSDNSGCLNEGSNGRGNGNGGRSGSAGNNCGSNAGSSCSW
ncbi:hypothetical protein FOT80_13890 [Serratia fonticola]|nr:hypothetical protein [Serratia fonticola]